MLNCCIERVLLDCIGRVADYHIAAVSVSVKLVGKKCLNIFKGPCSGAQHSHLTPNTPLSN